MSEEGAENNQMPDNQVPDNQMPSNGADNEKQIPSSGADPKAAAKKKQMMMIGAIVVGAVVLGIGGYLLLKKDKPNLELTQGLKYEDITLTKYYELEFKLSLTEIGDTAADKNIIFVGDLAADKHFEFNLKEGATPDLEITNKGCADNDNNKFSFKTDLFADTVDVKIGEYAITIKTEMKLTDNADSTNKYIDYMTVTSKHADDTEAVTASKPITLCDFEDVAAALYTVSEHKEPAAGRIHSLHFKANEDTFKAQDLTKEKNVFIEEQDTKEYYIMSFTVQLVHPGDIAEVRNLLYIGDTEKQMFPGVYFKKDTSANSDSNYELAVINTACDNAVAIDISAAADHGKLTVTNEKDTFNIEIQVLKNKKNEMIVYVDDKPKTVSAVAGTCATDGNHKVYASYEPWNQLQAIITDFTYESILPGKVIKGNKYMEIPKLIKYYTLLFKMKVLSLGEGNLQNVIYIGEDDNSKQTQVYLEIDDDDVIKIRVESPNCVVTTGDSPTTTYSANNVYTYTPTTAIELNTVIDVEIKTKDDGGTDKLYINTVAHTETVTLCAAETADLPLYTSSEHKDAADVTITDLVYKATAST